MRELPLLALTFNAEDFRRINGLHNDALVRARCDNAHEGSTEYWYEKLRNTPIPEVVHGILVTCKNLGLNFLLLLLNFTLQLIFYVKTDLDITFWNMGADDDLGAFMLNDTKVRYDHPLGNMTDSVAFMLNDVNWKYDHPVHNMTDLAAFMLNDAKVKYDHPAKNMIVEKIGFTAFFLYDDFRVGMKLRLLPSNPVNSAKILPRHADNSIPFSVDQLPWILRKFSIKPGSVRAKMIANVVEGCRSQIKGEHRQCVNPSRK
ncbi:uncharacterized protein LOC126687459 [Mercurialis annua]|uniref:uncharacterized protein LOC126687459 n=1 Tax=Mercurialis annua TaxID=3986 RepID=UPI00215FDBA9|nr:uncharacterized protein LOC126687459 [Mercurialis annua]